MLDDTKMAQTSHAPAVYRHKFSSQTLEAISNFAAIHRYDTPAQFRESWKEWIETQDELILSETRILQDNGYTGNITDKMYKSARYYFKNKSLEKTVTKERRKYISLSSQLLEKMDQHINRAILSGIKPADGYSNFTMDADNTELNSEMNILRENGTLSENEILMKFKKTYKNRYFTAVQRMKIIPTSQ